MDAYDLLWCLCLVILTSIIYKIISHLPELWLKIPSPDGPWGLPIIGYLPFIKRNGYLQFMKLSESYGDVLSINLLGQKYIILNSYESIKEAFGSKSVKFSGRPTGFSFLGQIEGKSVSYSEGDVWRQNRKSIHDSLSQQGMGRKELDPLILEIGLKLCDMIKSTNGQNVDVFELLTLNTTNVITSVLFSKTFHDMDDREYMILRDANRQVVKSWPHMDSFLSGSLFKLWKGNVLRQNYRSLLKAQHDVLTIAKRIIRERIEERRCNDYVHSKDYVDFFLNGLQDLRDDQIDLLAGMILNMFMAGTETTSTTLYHGLNLMANHPDVQSRVQREIDAVIGIDRLPSVEDRSRLPYVESVLAEIQRYSLILAFGLVRCNLDEETIRGLRIEKRSCVIANLYSVSRDKRFFKNPNEFDPSNFYDETSNSFKRIEGHMPFSIGKRNCVGEPLARQELFIFFVLMMRRFDWLPPDGNDKCDYNLYEGLARIPLPYEMRAVLRV